MSDKPVESESAAGADNAHPRKGLKRPLAPVVLALMLGLAGAAWGLHIPRFWLMGLLAGLLAVLFLLYFSKTFRSLPEDGKNRQE